VEREARQGVVGRAPARVTDPQLKLIGPTLGSTPAQRAQPRALPNDLLREASHRLGVMALLGATLWAVGTGSFHLAQRAMTHGDPIWRQVQAMDVIAGINVLVSLGVFFFARKHDRDPRRMLDLGLAYMVVTAFGIGMTWHWAGIPDHVPVFPVITWVGAIVLIFAGIVPSTPGKTLVAGLIAASMNPMGMLIARYRGTWNFGPVSNVLLMHYPDYVMVGVSVVISHVVTGLGQQVARAREMGSYRLGELLGRGGMGEVYHACHRMLARPAAIKLIRPAMIGVGEGAGAQLAVKRFRREAEVAASLRSPHTVELYDFGVTEDETFYFVMELLDGMTLEALVRRHGPVPAPRVIYILRQICDSLEEAHLRGLVHRDIKPANIHVGRLGLEHDFVKVLDFGLVKSTAGPVSEHSLATAAGLTPGTPAYMAPEMALGDAVDGRADLYALGCVSYYLLTGALVFQGESELQMLAQHLREEPVPPSRRTDRPIPAELERLVLACLAKQPEDRPRSAGELCSALELIAGEPWGEEQAAEWWKTNAPAMAAMDPRAPAWSG
jgi:eukaryotic-like serine/threonine-protein kinase